MAIQKKIPMRKCLATGEMIPKKQLVRIVRTKEGEVVVDPTGKLSGRGAYVSKTEEAVEALKKRGSLASHLGVPIPDAIYSDILRIIGREKLL